MKHIYTLLAATAAMLAGCSENDMDRTATPVVDMIDIEIAAHGDDATRVEYDDRSMLWQSGDMVAIVVASQSGTTSTLTAATGGSSSTILTGQIPRPADIDDYYAAYPADAVVSTSGAGHIVTLSIPSTQGSTTAPLLTAKCEQSAAADLAMTFTPATAILDISVSQPVISAVFEAGNGEAVAGEFSYDIAKGSTYDNTTLSATSIEYLGGSGQTRFKMLVPALSLNRGYKLTLTDASGNKMIQSYGYRSGISLTAGKAYPVNIEFVPLTIDMGALQTTYSRYLAGDIQAANDLTKRLTIIGSDATIAGASSTMIEEAGYYIGEEKHALTSGVKSFAIPDIEVAAQGTYNICTYAVINGQEYRSATQECIVTGLPLQSVPPTEAQGWQQGSWNTQWNTDHVKIGGVVGSGVCSITYSFHTPYTVNVSAYNKYDATGSKAGLIKINTTYTFTVGGATKISYKTSNNNTVSGENTFNDCTLSSSNNQVKCQSSYTAAGPYCRVYSVIVTYR